jgi:2-iminobutanoate/2-iminopropanoate deaminase
MRRSDGASAGTGEGGPVRVFRYGALLVLLIGAPRPACGQASPRFINPKSLPPPRGYTHVVEVPAGARLLYLSGQVPLDKDGNLVGAGDFRRQAEQVFRNLGLALAEAGASFADVVRLDYYVRDVSHLSELRAIRDQHVNTKAPPASTLVEVSRLFRDDVMLEVDAIAAIRTR